MKLTPTQVTGLKEIQEKLDRLGLTLESCKTLEFYNECMDMYEQFSPDEPDLTLEGMISVMLDSVRDDGDNIDMEAVVSIHLALTGETLVGDGYWAE